MERSIPRFVNIAFSSCFPIFSIFSSYYSFRDLLAGMIMAVTSIPQLVAYAENVGYAASRGLSTSGPSLLVWGLTTGSPWANCGVTAITSIMTRSTLDGDNYVEQYGEEEYVKLVSVYSIYIGLASLILSVTGLARLAQLIPKPVQSGFKWGIAFGVLCAAIPNGLLLHGKPLLNKIAADSKYLTFLNGYFSSTEGIIIVSKIILLLSSPSFWSLTPTIMLVVCTLFITVGGKYFTKSFPPGFDVILVTVGATLFSIYTNYDGAVIGEIPMVQSSPGLKLVPFEVLDYNSLFLTPIKDRCFNGSLLYLMLSSSIFAFVNFLSIVSIAYLFETEDNISWSSQREMRAQGIACFIAGMTGSAPVGGSFSRSLVSRMTGATSSFSCIVTALCWIWLLPYMSFMSCTPKAALSAIIISAVIKSVIYPKDLLQMRKLDRIVACLTAIVTAISSPTMGFLFGISLWNILRIVSTRYNNNIPVYLRIDALSSDKERGVDNKT